MLIGDEIEQLYRARAGHFVGLAEWLVGSRAHGEEIVQDVFIALVARPPTLRNPEALEAYVRRAVMNSGRTRLRRFVLERRHRVSITDVGSLDAHDDHGLRAAVVALPLRQRQCVVLRFYEDLTVDQIALELGLRPGTVKSHLHRAIASLGSNIDKGEDR